MHQFQSCERNVRRCNIIIIRVRKGKHAPQTRIFGHLNWLAFLQRGRRRRRRWHCDMAYWSDLDIWRRRRRACLDRCEDLCATQVWGKTDKSLEKSYAEVLGQFWRWENFFLLINQTCSNGRWGIPPTTPDRRWWRKTSMHPFQFWSNEITMYLLVCIWKWFLNGLFKNGVNHVHILKLRIRI